MSLNKSAVRYTTMGWSFAIINGKLGEIYFEEGKKFPQIFGHCYIKRNEYTTKRELKMIDKDIAKVKVLYKKGIYYLAMPKAENSA